MLIFAYLTSLAMPLVAHATQPTALTTSGHLLGTESDGVNEFKGIRFAQAPTGKLRWEPPVPFKSTASHNATTLPPACLQQFVALGPGGNASLTIKAFDTPAPASENEDCLFLNVWAPSPSNNSLKSVVVYLYGGAHEFGTGSLPQYDGTSIAKTQDIIFVSFNYRTNVLGFPVSPDLPLNKNNLGYLDQELAFQWVQDNIEAFGGDNQKVTIMGQSAGSQSISDAFQRHTPDSAPFRAGVMFSGASVSTSATPNFTSFNTFAAAMGCTQAPGAERLTCLREVPGETIHAFVNGPGSPAFGTTAVDNVTVFANPIERIRANLTARKPFIIGNMEDDGTFFVFGLTNLSAFLQSRDGGIVSADQARALYPGANDTAVMADVFRDLAFRCPASLWAAAFVDSGMEDVFRYSYGAVFSDLQIFPGAGAWHSSEIPELFGHFNTSTASQSEVTLSSTFQTAIANFIKDPTTSPAINWPKYDPLQATLAKIAYEGNVEPDNFVQPVTSDTLDGPCTEVWDALLDFTAEEH